MILCCCNAFSDKVAKKYLEEKEGRATVGKTYSHCSGGASPQCRKCLPQLKEMVQDHNNRKTVEGLGKALPENTPAHSRRKKTTAPAGL